MRILSPVTRHVSVSESAFERNVVELAHLYGWTVAHFRAARTANGWRTPVTYDATGFPDCVLCRPPRLIFAELKSEKGRVTDAQQGWLDALAACPNAECHVWRPSQLPEIAEILR